MHSDMSIHVIVSPLSFSVGYQQQNTYCFLSTHVSSKHELWEL